MEYFRPHRATSSSATTSIHLKTPSSNDRRHRNGSDVDLDNQMASSSILIFPNPPSERESLRSTIESRFEFSGSTSSLPTDVSLESVRSRSRSRSRGEEVQNGNESWQNLLRTLPHDKCWEELLLKEESEWEQDNGYLRQDHARYTSHSPGGHNGGHTRTSSSVNSPFTRALSLTLQLPFRLPFLSFLQNLLTLDESTLHLISRSPDSHASALFPVSPGPHSPAEGEEEPEPAHGTLRLLLHNPDKAKNIALLKAGMDPSDVPADANLGLVSPVRMPVLRILEFVIEGGMKAWKEVRAWDEAEAHGCVEDV